MSYIYISHACTSHVGLHISYVCILHVCISDVCVCKAHESISHVCISQHIYDIWWLLTPATPLPFAQ